MTHIGVDMGGTKCAGVLFGDDHVILAEMSVATPVGGEAVIDAIVGVVVELSKNVQERPRTVGVGVPGLVTPEGSLRYAPHLFGVVEMPLQRVLGDRIGRPVRVVNDNTAAGWAEHRVGAGRGFNHMVYVGLGTGIGGAIIANGMLSEGQHGFAGEMGHMTIDRGGARCVCGRRGCWELYGSGTGLARLAGAPGETVTGAARNGDDWALGILHRFASDVAVGLADLVNILDPGCIVLGGGVLDPPEPLLGFIRGALGECLGDASAHRRLPEVRAAMIGKRAGALGASMLAADVR